MMSSSKFFGVLLAGCLMLATSGCVVMDPADEAEYVEAEWADELLDEAVAAELEQGEAAEDQGYETATEEEDPDPTPDPKDLPDPFKQ